NLADVLQEQLKGVGGHVGLQVERGLRLAPAPLVRSTLHIRRRQRRIDLLNEFDLGPLEEAVKLFDVRLVEIELGDGGCDFGVREDAKLLPPGQESLDLFEFLQFRY